MTVLPKDGKPRHRSLPSEWTSILDDGRVVTAATANIVDISKYEVSILSTDFAPTRTEMWNLKAKITEQRNGLSLLNTEYSALRTLRRNLRSRIGKVEENIRLHESLISPHRRLPPELLGEIFVHCLSKKTILTANPETAPLLLTHVCRRWRRIAYGTPHLWAKLNLSGGFLSDPTEAVALWLVYSGSLSLDIRVGSQEWRSDVDPLAVELILSRLLVQSLHRCRSLVGSASLMAIEEMFRHEIFFPNLETFELCLPARNFMTPPVPYIATLHTPVVSSILLDNTCFITNGLRNPLPSLRQLQLTGQEEYGLLSHSRCLDFIALCPNLESCTLTLSKDPGSRLHSAVVLDSLRHLHLIFKFSPHDPIPFLRALQTPNIEILTLQNHGGVSPVPHIRRVLGLLLSVRPHTIKELHLSSLFVPTSDWVPSLVELTMLESLSITGDSLDESFFAALGREGPPSIWSCPRLTTLKLHHVTGLLGVSGDRLVDFIRSRTKNQTGNVTHGETTDSFTFLRSVSLILCALEQRHVLELQEIERQSGGSLRLHGLGDHG